MRIDEDTTTYCIQIGDLGNARFQFRPIVLNPMGLDGGVFFARNFSPDQVSRVMSALHRLTLSLLAYVCVDVLAYRHVGARACSSWTSHREIENGSKYSTRTALPPT